MYLPTSDGVNDVDIDDELKTQQRNTQFVTSNTSQPSSPSCSTLLVIDDNSNSNDSSLNTTDILSNQAPSATTETSSVQTASSTVLPTTETSNDTPEQQRRRNSSIAKLLGGLPLKNQPYNEINQQVLEDQSVQNMPNNSDNKTDDGIQRSRSSVTRKLLKNAEQNNDSSTTATNDRAPSPSFARDFEYLIRRELDIEHASSTLQRDSSKPSVFQSLNSIRTSPSTDSQSALRVKLKRKRSNPKQTTTIPTVNTSSNIAPFTIRDPFELNSSVSSLPPSINSSSVHRSHHQQNRLFHFDVSHQHPHHRHQTQFQQQNSSPMTHPNSLSYQKLTSSPYTRFKIQQDRLPAITPCSSSSCHCPHYPHTIQLELPTPVSPISIHTPLATIASHHMTTTSSRKTKATHMPPDIYEMPMQRSFATAPNSSNFMSTSSSGHTIPLKKRLLHAYNNEQRPSSAL